MFRLGIIEESLENKDILEILKPYFISRRIERLKAGEKQKFGDRIMPGGDMYTNHIEFIEWARKYDTGSVDMRSKAKHNEWQKLLPCKQIV